MGQFSAYKNWSQIKKLLTVALPISIGLMSQNLMSVIDAVMISQLGFVALAAIGLGGIIVFVINASVVGFSTYVQRETSFNLGRNEQELKHSALLSAIFVASLSIPLLTLLLKEHALPFLHVIHHDEQVVTQVVPYVEIRIWGLVLVAINFAFRGFYSAAHLLKLYLLVIVVMHTLNVGLNYCLIFGEMGMPAMGVEGAGLASLIATLVATFLNVWMLIKMSPVVRSPSFSKMYKTVVDMWRIVFPYGMQQVLFVTGFAVFIWVVGLTGTQNLAIASVILNISTFFFLPAIGFGVAAAGQISYGLGKEDKSGALQWASLSFRLVLLIFFLLSLPLLFFTDLFMQVFFTEQVLIDLSILPMQLAALMFTVEAMSLVLLQILFVVNKGVAATIRSVIVQWVFFLPVLYVLVNASLVVLDQIWMLLVVFRLINLSLLFMLWREVKENLCESLNACV